MKVLKEIHHWADKWLPPAQPPADKAGEVRRVEVQ